VSAVAKGGDGAVSDGFLPFISAINKYGFNWHNGGSPEHLRSNALKYHSTYAKDTLHRMYPDPGAQDLVHPLKER
jgi:hypothetical protein